MLTRESRVVPVTSLTSYPGNARRGDIESLRESLRFHGQYRDIVVQKSTGYVLAGNHTLQAAIAEGWTEIGACFIDVDDQQAKKIVLVDNRSNDVAGYDIPALADLLKDMETLEGTGFDDKALEAVMASLNLGAKIINDPDEAPELPKAEPKTKLGDLYLLGEHRLLCGDCTNMGSVDKLLDGKAAQLLFTDPPFNLNFDGFRVGKHRAKGSQKPTDAVMNDKMSDEDFEQFLRDSFASAVAYLEADASVYVWIDWRSYPALAPLFKEVFDHKNTIIWDKMNIGIGLYNYRTQYEMLLFGVKGKRPKTWTAGHNERDVWQQKKDYGKELRHVNQKPVELAERAIKNSSVPGNIVLDLFAGSGSTLIACETTGRVSYNMELDPRYCDVIVSRWETATGQKAQRV